MIKRTVAIIALVVGTAQVPNVCAQAPAPTDPGVSARPEEAHVIKIAARKYEFTPNSITVRKGDRVKLLITALDHDHGFKLEDFGVELVVKKGNTAQAEFTADKVGKFAFRCSHFCGLGHSKMRGELIVEE